MAEVAFKGVCIDAVDAPRARRFWSAALGLAETGSERTQRLTGPTPAHDVWINEVSEAKTVKNRMHLDVHTGALTDLEALGATIIEPARADRHWTVMRDPEGQEFCAFVRDEAPAYKLYEIVVDIDDDPGPVARWWAERFDTAVHADDDGSYWIEIPGAPFELIVFGQVPEAKTVKNRVHLDVYGDADALIAAGAKPLTEPAGVELGWQVLADPAGNEFCVFEPVRT